jgi:YesN/AraC family two-component response regulator
VEGRNRPNPASPGLANAGPMALAAPRATNETVMHSADQCAGGADRIPTPPVREAPVGGSAPRAQTILIVDDEVDILESLKQLFEVSLKDVKVETAEGGAAALAIIKAQPVDLIVTDYKMPGMNGLEFLNEAKKLVPKVPRILVTAFPDLELAIKAVNDAKIENFFTKPVEPSKVIEIVRNVLAERRAQEMRDQSFARSLDALRRQLDKKK